MNILNKLKYSPLVLLSLTAMVMSCGPKDNKKAPKEPMEAISNMTPLKGDSAIYGLACDGCCDSVLVILPAEGGDPQRYNVVDARQRGLVLGSMSIGDWVTIVPTGKGSHKAIMALDLDEIKGTWTYTVMPTFKDTKTLAGKETLKRFLEMPDSVKETYMVPRQYGFTLSSNHVAGTVGMIRANQEDDNSPVEYPLLRWFTEWHPWNGKIIITQGTFTMSGYTFNKVPVSDTLSVPYMSEDSLVLMDPLGEWRGYNRQKDAMSANAAADAAAQKQAQMAREKLK